MEGIDLIRRVHINIREKLSRAKKNKKYESFISKRLKKCVVCKVDSFNNSGLCIDCHKIVLLVEEKSRSCTICKKRKPKINFTYCSRCKDAIRAKIKREMKKKLDPIKKKLDPVIISNLVNNRLAEIVEENK